MSGIVVPFATEEESRHYPTAALGQSLNRKALEQEVPGLAPHWQAGLLFEQDGQIDNRRQLMRALEKACVSLGVQFLEGAEVQASVATATAKSSADHLAHRRRGGAAPSLPNGGVMQRSLEPKTGPRTPNLPRKRSNAFAARVLARR